MTLAVILAFIKRWRLAIEIAVAVLLVTILWFWLSARHEASVYRKQSADVAKAQATALAETQAAKEARQRADGLQIERDTLQAERTQLLAKVVTLQDELTHHPKPPQPGPPPAEQGQLLADLHTMGTSPDPLPPARVAFPNSDTPTLWNWGKQALRVPGLESRLTASENLTFGLQNTLDTTTKQLGVAEQQRDGYRDSSVHFENAFTSEHKAAGILTVQLDTTTKQRDRARKTRIYFGLGGLALGGYLGYRLTGHH